MSVEKTDLNDRLDSEVRTLLETYKSRPTPGNWICASKVSTFNQFLSNKMVLICTIREGIRYSFFDLIQHASPFSETYWAELLELSPKSLNRYRQQDRLFKSIHTEKILEMAEVSNLGVEIFGDMEKFRLWLETPSYALGRIKPIELLKDSYGKEMVTGELTRISHGILA